MKLWTCFSALVSSSFLATTATTSTVQPAPCNAAMTCVRPHGYSGDRPAPPARPHHDPGQEADAASAVSVRHHVSVADGQEGDGDHPQSFHVVAAQVPVVVMSAGASTGTSGKIAGIFLPY